MDFKGNTMKRKNDDKPLCKYGLSCFRKNPEHRKKFKHPTENVIFNSKYYFLPLLLLDDTQILIYITLLLKRGFCSLAIPKYVKMHFFFPLKTTYVD